MSWDHGRLSEHGDTITAARGCRCDTCLPKAERLEAMLERRNAGTKIADLSEEFGWSPASVSKYLRMMEGATG